MRRLRFFLIGLALTTCFSCVKDDAHDGQDGSTPGELTVLLSADSATGAMTTKTDSETEVREAVPAEFIPNLDDFEVEVYKDEAGKEKLRLYRDTYANSVGKTIRLNTGTYRLLAQHGDSLGCGFNKPYFVADQIFDLTPDNLKMTVNATAYLGNMQMSVSFDESVSGSYYDYYVVVRHADHEKKSLKFVKDEERLGYMPAGNVVVEFYADLTGNGDWMYSKSPVYTYSPRDFVKINIIVTDPREGHLLFNINVDGTENVHEENLEIPDWATPQAAPTIVLSGFDENDACSIIEGVNLGEGGSASILARGAIANCYLKVESDFLASKGLTSEEIDLAAPTEEQAEMLKEAGIHWDEDMLGSRALAYISFTDMIEAINAAYKSSKLQKTVAVMTIRVVDEVGKSEEKMCSVVSVPVVPLLSVEDYNVWANKIVGTKVTVSEGANKSLFQLQYRETGGLWQTHEASFTGSGNVMTAGDITGLKPGAKYQIRVIYNNNENVISDAINITTEKALQIGNSGFEEFYTADFNYTAKGDLWSSSSQSRKWYLPWASADVTDKWWAVNSRRTMPSETTEDDLDYKVFPTCSYTINSYSGGKSAQITTVYVASDADASSDGSANVRKAVGELFIGVADDDTGNPVAYGHSFSSRPAALKFMYRYNPYGNDTFYARIELRDEDDNIIAEGQITDKGAVDRWTPCTVELNYINVQAVPSSIYVSFRSSSKSDSAAPYNSNASGQLEMAGTTYNGRFGSVLKVDDLELLYY